jgi:hypothetical protein
MSNARLWFEQQVVNSLLRATRSGAAGRLFPRRRESSSGSPLSPERADREFRGEERKANLIRQFAMDDKAPPVAIGWFGRAAVWLVIALVAPNVISTLLECGFGACPDNPVSYQSLKGH